MAQKLIIRNTQSPGDYVVLTSAIRDIQRAHPGRFDIMMDVPQQAIFQQNPYVKGVKRTEAGVRIITAKYPAIHQSNQRKGIHFMWGFIEYLNRELGTSAVLTDFRPDLHLSAEEKMAPPCGVQKPYWVFVSGGKTDFTAKWWDPNRWQQVAHILTARGHKLVQVGGGSHKHPPIQGVTDLVNKTSFRELMRLIYHSEGVLCIVTCLMHLAAGFNRPCVVVGGGREPWWWEAYNAENRLTNMRKGIPAWQPPAQDDFIPHRYLHTIDKLDCCMNKGCWKSRIEGTNSVCIHPIKVADRRIPQCLDMIGVDDVVNSVEWYYEQGILTRNAPKLALPPLTQTELLPATIAEPASTEASERLRAAILGCRDRWLIVNKGNVPEGQLAAALAKVTSANGVIGGLLTWRPVESAENEAIKRLVGADLTRHPWRQGVFKAYQVDPAFFILDCSILKNVAWPEVALEDELIGTFLAEKVRQCGGRVVDLGDTVGYL